MINNEIIKKVNSEILEYIERNIFTQYNSNDVGHGLTHIYDVINRSFDLLENLKLDLDLLLYYSSGLS